ncbi:FAD binding domain-containing protein [Lanmaoa asiatica]|nr:FAD binding domain-containing protein [Lanmaoa asiatica]
MTRNLDCIVVGGGHAGASAALSAVQAGCKDVLIVEKAPEEWVGGNGYFTAGAHRTVHAGLADLLPIVTNVTTEQAERIDVAPYTIDDFIGDIMRLGENKPNPELVKTMVENSRDAIQWLAEIVKIPFILAFHRQAYEVDGRQKFWGGLALSVEDGGKGLIKTDLKALRERGVKLWFNTPAVKLITEGSAVTGVVVRRSGEEILLKASAVILACGGYESSRELRMKYLGPDWKHARVRGTPYNTGDGISMAQAIGAKLVGDWQGCHSTCWDANAPTDAGDRELSNQFTKSGYPLGIMVNINGERFVDEGQDFRNYTYAKFGRQILLQPEGCAFQAWDVTAISRLRREEYGDDVVEKITASTIEELADRLVDKGLQDKASFLRTVREYNDAVHQHRMEHPGHKWDPAIKDGLSTQSSKQSLTLAKSNWALPIEKGPFLAVKVACGITFTFGGIAIDPETSGVLSERGEIIRGLFCTGEMIGDLYYNNYPGGSGLTGGTVFGIKAGRAAAELAHSEHNSA